MIKMRATEQEQQAARDFANTYDEHNYGENVLGVSHDEFIRFIVVGKLTELVVKRLFEDNNIPVNTDNMLIPAAGDHRIGPDIILEYSKQEIDVKAANQHFHSRLLVREDQVQAHIHDIYIGTKCIDETNVEIHGYIKGADLEKLPIGDYGYGPCRHMLLRDLTSINQLIEKAKNNISI